MDFSAIISAIDAPAIVGGIAGVVGVIAVVKVGMMGFRKVLAMIR